MIYNKDGTIYDVDGFSVVWVPRQGHWFACSVQTDGFRLGYGISPRDAIRNAK